MADPVFSPRDADIDIGRLFAAIWRDKFRILFGAIVLTALVALVLSLLAPTYKSDARILIDAGESVFTRPAQDVGNDQALLDQEAIESQVQIMTSSDLLMKVAEDLKLGALPEFDETLSMSAFKRGLVTLGLAGDPAEVSAEKRVLSAMRSKLQVYPVEGSRVIVIEFQSEDPEIAARVPNAIAAAYTELESTAQLDNTDEAATYLEGEIAQLEAGVRDAEARVADFRSSSGLLVGQGETILATQQLAELSTELSRVRAQRSSIEARVQSVESALSSGAALDAQPDVIASPLIGRLVETQVRLNAELADLSSALLPGHPRIKALNSQIADLDIRLRQQAEKVLNGLRSEAAIARDRENELNRDLAQLKAASSDANTQEVELRALEREAASQRALLESYLIRYREARSRGEGDYAPAKARVISRATVPFEATFPKMVPLLGATFVASLIALMLITLMRELFSGRALVPAATGFVAEEAFEDDEADIAAQPTMFAPQAAAEVSAANNKPVASARTQSDVTGFTVEGLAEKLMRRGAGRAIFVTPLGAVGSSNPVILARHLDAEGLRTIVVDLTGEGTASRLMLEDFDVTGISDLLAAEASYADVIHGDRASRAHVMPIGLADQSRALAGIGRLPIILSGLGSAYDLVIVDCGPTDAAGLMRLVTDDSELILSIDPENAEQAVVTAQDLLDAGFDDVLVVLEEGAPDHGPGTPARRRAAG